MAKKRYSLGETMDDAASAIKNAQQSTDVDLLNIPKEEVNEEPEAIVMDVEEVKVKQKLAPATIEKKKKKAKEEVVTEIESEGKSNMRNVELDDETLWRLDTVKNKLNRVRGAGEPLVTQKSIIGMALLEWLDKNYPETKEAYHIINNL